MKIKKCPKSCIYIAWTQLVILKTRMLVRVELRFTGKVQESGQQGYQLTLLLKETRNINQAMDHSFYRFAGAIMHTRYWENTRKACKSQAAKKMI